MPPLGSSMLSVCSNVVQCHSLSSCCYPHFVTPDRHRSLVLFNTVHPSFLRSSSCSFCGWMYTFGIGVWYFGIWCWLSSITRARTILIASVWTLVPVVWSFRLWLVAQALVAHGWLSLYAVRIILLSQRFSQASSQFSMCLVRLHPWLTSVCEYWDIT